MRKRKAETLTILDTVTSDANENSDEDDLFGQPAPTEFDKPMCPDDARQDVEGPDEEAEDEVKDTHDTGILPIGSDEIDHSNKVVLINELTNSEVKNDRDTGILPIASGDKTTAPPIISGRRLTDECTSTVSWNATGTVSPRNPGIDVVFFELPARVIQVNRQLVAGIVHATGTPTEFDEFDVENLGT